MRQEHGGDIYHYSRLLGIRPEEIIDFSASINPLGPSKAALESLSGTGFAVSNYPEPSSGELREAIAYRYGIDSENIMVGNGSTELIYLIPKALRPEFIIISRPTFSEYERAGIIAGVRIVSIKNKDHRIDLDKVVSAFSHAGGLLFLCNPNNPTGELIKKSDLLDLIDRGANAGIIVVIDEAFIDYAESESLIRNAEEASNLIVLRSFTKFFALPGLRIGYLVSNKRMIEKIKGIKEPWSVNSLAQMAATQSLKDHSYITDGLLFMEKRRRDFCNRLAGINGIRPFPSHANFFLIRVEKDGLRSEDLFDLLLKRRIAVRNCRSFEGLDGEFIRVAVKGEAENNLLIDSLRSVIWDRP